MPELPDILAYLEALQPRIVGQPLRLPGEKCLAPLLSLGNTLAAAEEHPPAGKRVRWPTRAHT